MGSNIVKTTCAYCGVGCGVSVQTNSVQTNSVQANSVHASQRDVIISGDQQHPANFGKLCSKGTSLAETLGLQGRLLYPQVQGKRTDWPTALSAVATGFQKIIDQHGPEAVAFYCSGQLLTEDYYVANKLMKGCIGSANIDTNSRLCMASAVVGHKRAFGADIVPGCYDDIEHAELVVLAGSNAAWCHPILFQRIRRAKELNSKLKVVVIDPRRTASCDIADLHLNIKPGSDINLFNGLFNHLFFHKKIDQAYIEDHTEGFELVIEESLATAPSVDHVANACGVSAHSIGIFYEWFSNTEKSLTMYSQGINQSSHGSDNVNSIINCHLATGRIGKPGMGPFSLTGQPNAMGGREVGGMANQLAAHMDFKDSHIDRVQRFWQTPTIARFAGLKAVELFDAIHEGRVKAVWIMGTNPVDSLPDANKIIKALQKAELVVVSDCIEQTDTNAYAHIKLPALGWGEKDGSVTNSERRISRQRRFLEAPGDAKADWWIISEVAKQLGFAKHFHYSCAKDIFCEHAALSGFENSAEFESRDFDISALASLSLKEYDTMQPVQWPVNTESPKGSARLFHAGGFYTPTGRAQFIPIATASEKKNQSDYFPLVLNTGRVRDHWHTMTRTGLSPTLSQHLAEPYAELHPDDAYKHGINDKDIVRLSTPWGSMLARALLSEGQQPGSVFVPMHWNNQFANDARVGALVNPIVDPLSGQPESKMTPVKVQCFPARWFGYLLTREELGVDFSPYCVKIKGEAYYRYELAGDVLEGSLAELAASLLGALKHSGEWLEYTDATAMRYRAANLNDKALHSCIFLSRDSQLPDTSWLASLFAEKSLTTEQRKGLLAARPQSGAANVGRIICSCFAVGENTIKQAIQSQGLKSVDAISQCLKAGSNCGSCVPDLRQLLD